MHRPGPAAITSSLVVLFKQFAKYCKPSRLVHAVANSLKTNTADTAAGRSSVEWNLLLCKLVVSWKEVPALARAMVAMDDLILLCLNRMLALKNVKVLCDVVTLLQILLCGEVIVFTETNAVV